MCIRTIFRKPWSAFLRAFLMFHWRQCFILFHTLFRRLWKGKKLLPIKLLKLSRKSLRRRNGLRRDLSFRKQIAWRKQFGVTQKPSASASILRKPTTIAELHAAIVVGF